MNKLSIEIKLFIILFKLAQLVKLVLTLIEGELYCHSLNCLKEWYCEMKGQPAETSVISS